MTEEPETRNNRTFYWLGGFIVFGLLALAGIFIYLKYFAYPDDEKHANFAYQAKAGRLLSAIHDYQSWTAKLPDRRMNEDHELTRAGMHKIADILLLIDTLNTTGKSSAKANIDTIRMLADSITQNWRSGKHADMIKKAFEKTALTVKVLFPRKTGELEKAIDKLDVAAENINQDVLTLNQRDAVKAGFIRTAEIFRYTGIK